MSTRAALLSLATALVLGLAACASGGSPAAPAPMPSAADDPVLLAAADSVHPWLEHSYGDSFSGLELDHQNHVMIVYRRTNPRLDADLATRLPGVRVVLRDARYSLSEMRAAIDRLSADEPYWRGRGLPITGTASSVDGSGITVFTSGNVDELSEALAGRYSGMTFSVRQQSIRAPIYSGSPPVWGGR